MTERRFAPPQQFTLTAQQETTALDLLSAGSGLSKQRIKDAMNKGAVWWTQKGKTLRLRRATKVLTKGTQIQLYYDEQVLARLPGQAVCIQDLGRYSIWYKPQGMLSQGSTWGDHCSILRWIEVNGQFTDGKKARECLLVHRLDADAAGLMLIAHDSQMAAKLSSLFQGRDIQKYYQAWAQQSDDFPADGITITEPVDGKSATTHAKVMLSTPEALLLDVHIETGRKHQIRRHLAHIGHPIIGDKLYGKRADQGLQLLAYRLRFTCPISQRPLDIVLDKQWQLLPKT